MYDMEGIITLRINAKQKAAIKKHAAKKGLGISAFIRLVVLKALKEG